MANELEYKVGSREIIDLISSIRKGKLTKSPYFQRNLVWRETHKREFIETILMGYPFPQIFLARGKINIAEMDSYNCIVDGQQRLTSIEEFVDDKLTVRGKKFSELSEADQEAFVKYKVAVIDFDLDEGDERLKEVFARLNRTYYSLSNIEKISSEFSGSEFLIAARALCGDFVLAEDDEEASDAENPFKLDPSLRAQTVEWAQSVSVNNTVNLIQSGQVFSNYEASRKVPLMFFLNIMSTIEFESYYNRTEKIKDYLEANNDYFENKDEIVLQIERVSELITRLSLEHPEFWFRKANFFTMLVEFAKLGEAELRDLDVGIISGRLDRFAIQTPDAYSLAQREAVNNKKQRAERGDYFREYVIEGDERVLTEGTSSDRLFADLLGNISIPES